MEQEKTKVNITNCAICQTPITEETEVLTACPDCGTQYHQDCWEENQGCAIFGCDQVPDTEHLQKIEIPVSFWGKETKDCPNCKKEILAAAMRCKHCGTTFTSARPMDQSSYYDGLDQEERLPAIRRTIIGLTILSLIPFTTTIGGIILFFWYRKNRKDIKALPALYDGICKVALWLALIQTILITGILSIY